MGLDTYYPGSHVVEDFPDVLLEDLLGLLPNIEIEFCIDLVPRVEPISITLYIIALAELTKLRK